MRLLLLAALVPPFFLLWTIYKMDKIEREPLSLIVKLFLFGALMCFPAGIIESFGDSIIQVFLRQGSLFYHFVDAFLIVALAEEGVKYFILKKLTWNHPAFDYHFDGVVYAATASLGFAALENILYVFGAGTLSDGLSLAASRGLLSIPGHCIFGIFMGIYYSQAKHADRVGDPERFRQAKRNSMLVPVLLHGFYDFCLFTGNSIFIGIFFVFIIVVYIRAYRRIRQYASQDRPV